MKGYGPEIFGERNADVYDAWFGAPSDAATLDPVTQTVQYQYIVFGPDGVGLHPVPMRYAWPGELDLMAQLAGLELRERWGGWDRSAFTASSSAHVSVYARAETLSE